MTVDPLLARLSARVADLEPRLRELRRDLHAHPELSHEETRTTAVVAEALRSAGIEPTFLPGTGLLADLGPSNPTHRVALRADLDALPVAERTGLPFASTLAGVCHACGHDVHATALVGAAWALAAEADLLASRGLAVRIIAQPAEETVPGGAHEAIAHGAMVDVDAVFAVHCDPSLDVGSVGLREGPLTAACDHVRVVLHGRGGHTSRPYRTEDLNYALAKVVTDVPAALGRRLDPRFAATLVFGMLSSGKAANVIPSTGEAIGTLRILDAAAWQGAGELVTELVREVVAPYGVQAHVEYTKGVPPVVNHPDAVTVLRTATMLAGARPVATTQSLGGEDFSWYLDHAPGAMARLGTRTPGGPTYDLHQGDLVVDEGAIVVGARLLAHAALSSPLSISGARPDVAVTA